MPENLLDRTTSVDDKLARVIQLLESQMATDGVTETITTVNPTPFEYATVPNGPDLERLTVPFGETVLDFDQGKVTNENEGKIADLRDFEDMSQGIDADVQNLRSLWLYADAPTQVRLDTGEWFSADPGIMHPFVSQGFKRVTLEAPTSFEVYAVASTRKEPFTDSDSVRTHIARRTDARLTSAAPDSYEAVEWAPDRAFLLDGPLGEWTQTYGAHPVYTAPCDSVTVQVENTSSNANDLDARILAADTDYQAGESEIDWESDWYTIAETTNLSQGDHHVFSIDQTHRWLQVEYRNSTNGNNVDMSGSLHGVV